MKLNEGSTFDRSASMSRRKQLRPFRVQDDDDDVNNGSHTGNANHTNSADNGLETTSNGNNVDNMPHNTPESGKSNFQLVCIYHSDLPASI